MNVFPVHENVPVYIDSVSQPEGILYWCVDEQDVVWRCHPNLSQTATSMTGKELWELVLKGQLLAVLPPHDVWKLPAGVWGA